MEKGERDTVTKKRKGPGAKEVFARKLPKHLCPPLSLSLTSFTFPFSSFFSAGTFPPGVPFVYREMEVRRGKLDLPFFTCTVLTMTMQVGSVAANKCVFCHSRYVSTV